MSDIKHINKVLDIALQAVKNLKEENKQLKDENHRLLTIIEKLSNGK
jgi:hypothetical protein